MYICPPVGRLGRRFGTKTNHGSYYGNINIKEHEMSRVIKPVMIFVLFASLVACAQEPVVTAPLSLPTASFTPYVTGTNTALLTPTPWYAGTETALVAATATPPPPAFEFTLTPVWTSTFMPVVEMPQSFSPILYGKKYDANTFFFLLGGWQGDRWLPPAEAFGYFANLQSWEYDVYTPEMGKFQITGHRPEFSPAHKIYTVGTDMTVDKLGMVGVRKGWPVLQRDVQELSSDIDVYRQVVLDWLAVQGISAPELAALHVFRVDLEGDGMDEIFISATRLADQHMTKSGDYSIILMRKVQGNDAITLPVVSEVYHSQELEMTLPRTYSLGNFLDLNLDGVLEVVVDIRRWDGDGAYIYQVAGQNITQVP
jgi:hypothetical protein